MASTIKVNEIQNLAGNTALTIDGNGVVNRPQTPHIIAGLPAAGWQTYSESFTFTAYTTYSSSGITENSGVFSVATEGLYYIAGNFYTVRSGGSTRITIFLDGVQHALYHFGAGTEHTLTPSTLVYLTPANSITFRNHYGDTQIYTQPDHTNIYMYKVS